MSREDILDQIRFALGRSDDTTPAVIPEARLSFTPVEMDKRIARFTAALEALGGRVLRAMNVADAKRMVAEIAGGAEAVASQASFLDSCGIPDLAGVRSRFANREEHRAACAEAAFGITSADYALADTGSLVLFSGAEESRLVSLLPPEHIAVVPLNRLLTGLNELLTLVPLPAERSSAMVIITGPSRTADIEQILVRGVHGPGRITVILVDAPFEAPPQAPKSRLNEGLRDELVAMRAEDLRVREELLRSGELGEGYAPAMEAVHRKNAARLREIIAEHGWPDTEVAGPEGTLSAWFIAQHSIGEPDFQREALRLVKEKVRLGKVPAAQEAYLSDRIAMYEGRPQNYGTQSVPWPDGEYRRWTVEDPDHLNQRRAAVGMPPAPEDAPQKEPTPETLAEYEEWRRGYEEWLRKAGWRSD